MSLTLKDAKKPVVIVVNKSHCTRGVRGAKNHCIIALAAKEQTKGFVTDVRIGLRYTTFKLSSGDRLRYSTPYKTAEQLKEFDKGGPLLSPGVYKFKPPTKAESIEYQRIKNAKYNSPTYKKTRKNKTHRKWVASRKVIYKKLALASN